MKVKGLRLFQLIPLVVVSSICLTSCVVVSPWRAPVVWTDENHQRPQHTYYYYPDASVYYEPGPSLYFWFENNSWHSDRRLPSHIVLPKRQVRFKSDADVPYKVHEKVVERYRPDNKARDQGEKRQEDKRQNKGQKN